MNGEFIHPKILKIANDLKFKNLDEIQILKSFQTPERLFPPKLIPFLESQNLNKLAKIIKTNPLLYGHSIVHLQVAHLLRLCRDQKEWDRLGWKWVFDESQPSGYGMPDQVKEAHQHLVNLVTAYVAGILPGHEVVAKRIAKRPGPKGGIENPCPFDSMENIPADELQRNFDTFHRVISSQNRELIRKISEKESREDAKVRIIQLALDALDDAGPSWSTMREMVLIDSEEDECNSPPENFDYPLLSKGKIFMDYLFRWSIDLGEVVEPLLTNKFSPRMKKEGRPAYLAYAILGKLLSVSPDKIRNTIKNYN